MTSIPPDLVYRGFWVDHSRGPILGATITLSSATANVILVGLSMLIAFTQSHLWDLIAFVYFVLSMSQARKDAVHHQRQVLLRNMGTSVDFFWECIKVMWYWRKMPQRAWLRMLLPLILAILCTLGFLVAGIFSSQVVVTRGLNVLVDSNLCGYVTLTPDASVTNVSLATNLIAAYKDAQLKDIAQYTTPCYTPPSDEDPHCQVFIVPSIPLNSSGLDACPFGDACLLSHNAALSFDTGLLDTNDMFGVNAKSEDRLKFRKTTTCSPVDANKYLKLVGNVDVEPYLGRKPWQGEEFYGWFLGSKAENLQWTELASSFVGNSSVYPALKSIRHSRDNTSSSSGDLSPVWIPIPEVAKDDADTALNFVFLNAIRFSDPVDDPIFMAHKPVNITGPDGQTSTWYAADSPGSIIGCLEKYQYCSPKGACTSLQGSIDAIQEASTLALNRKQAATLQLFNHSISPSGLSISMGTPGEMFPPFLNALDTLKAGGFHTDLPDNQWQVEIRLWHSFTLAGLQQAVATHAIGSALLVDSYAQIFASPSTDEEKELCHAQKMRAPDGFSNVNVFGLSLIVACCGVVVFINLLLTNVIRLLVSHGKITWGPMRTWTSMGLLQIQRYAYEAAGAGRWRGDCRDVPVTDADDMFWNLNGDEKSERKAIVDSESTLAYSGNSSKSAKSLSSTEILPTEHKDTL